MTAVLEAADVHVRYRTAGAPDTHALRGVSIAIEPGEAVGLVGESGSGKSTLAKVLLGLVRPSSGRVRFEGTDFDQLGREGFDRLRRAVQPVFQDPSASLDPRMTVAASIEEPLVVHRIGDRARRARRVAELLARVGLDESHGRRHPHELSGGQRQRVAIARALTVEPKLVVADEAVSALDVSVQAQILNLFKDLSDDFGLAYLFVAHDLAAVDFLCDRTIVMKDGAVVETLARGSLATGGEHPYTRELVAAVPTRAGIADRY